MCVLHNRLELIWTARWRRCGAEPAMASPGSATALLRQPLLLALVKRAVEQADRHCLVLLLLRGWLRFSMLQASVAKQYNSLF